MSQLNSDWKTKLYDTLINVDPNTVELNTKIHSNGDFLQVFSKNAKGLPGSKISNLTVGVQSSTGDFIISNTNDLSLPVFKVKSTGDVVIENDLIVNGSKTLINSTNENLQTPLLNVGLQNLVSVDGVILISNNDNDGIVILSPDNVILNNMYHSVSYSTGLSCNVPLLNNNLTLFNYFSNNNNGFINYGPYTNQQFSLNGTTINVYDYFDKLCSTIFSSTPSIYPSIKLYTSCFLPNYCTTSSSISLTPTSYVNISVDSTEGFKNNGLLLYVDSSDNKSLIGDITLAENTITFEILSTPEYDEMNGNYIAIIDSNNKPYILGSVKSHSASVSGSNTTYIVDLKSNIDTNTLNAETFTYVSLCTNIYYKNMIEDNFVNCTSSKSITLNSNNKLYSSNSLADKTLYISSYSNSSITIVDNYDSNSSINLDYIPTDLLINTTNYLYWNNIPYVNSYDASNAVFTSNNGQINSYINIQEVPNDTVGIKFNFTDTTNSTSGKSIMFDNANNMNLNLDNINGNSKTYFNFGYNDYSLNFNNNNSSNSKVSIDNHINNQLDLNASKINFNGGITGSTAHFNNVITSTLEATGLVSAIGGIVGSNANFIDMKTSTLEATGLVSAIGGITGSNSNFNNMKTSTLEATGLVSAIGGITGSNSNFNNMKTSTLEATGLVSAMGGITGTNAHFNNMKTSTLEATGMVSAIGGITGSNAHFEDMVTSTLEATGLVSAIGGITGTNAHFEDMVTSALEATGLVSAIGGITGSNAHFEDMKTSTLEATGLVSAIGGITGSIGYLDNMVINNDLDVVGDTYMKSTLYAANIISSNITTTSDRRLKENFVRIKDSLNKVLSLDGVYFDWIDKDKYNNNRNVGFIAQQMQEVIPELVILGNDGFLSVNYSQTTAVLVEAMKEQQKMILNLQTQLNEIEKKLYNTMYRLN